MIELLASFYCVRDQLEPKASERERCLAAFENKLYQELLYLEPVGGSKLLAIPNHLKNKRYGY